MGQGVRTGLGHGASPVSSRHNSIVLFYFRFGFFVEKSLTLTRQGIAFHGILVYRRNYLSLPSGHGKAMKKTFIKCVLKEIIMGRIAVNHHNDRIFLLAAKCLPPICLKTIYLYKYMEQSV